MDDLRVGHPGGRRDQHPVLGAEQGEAGVEDRLLAAGAHDDAIGIDRPPARHPAELPRDAAAQLGDADVGRIAGESFLGRLDAGLRRRSRRVEVGLADAEIEDVLARGLAALGLVADGHGLGGLEVLDVGRQGIGHAELPEVVSVGREGESSPPAQGSQPADLAVVCGGLRLGSANAPSSPATAPEAHVPSYPDLHLPPTIAAAVERLGWASDDLALREAAPTAARGHNLVVVAPPAPAYAVPALAGMMAGLGPERRALLLCADAQLEEWGAIAAALGRSTVSVQMARTSARAARRLKAAEVQVIVTSPATAAELQQRSALEPDQIGAVFLAFPESWDDPDALAPLMQDLGKDTQRIICTSSAERTADLTERYARRALVVGGPAADAAAPAPQGPVRTAGVSWSRRVAILAELLEVLDPSSAVVWTADRSRHDDIARVLPPGDSSVRLVTGEPPKASVVIAFDLPTPASARATAGGGRRRAADTSRHRVVRGAAGGAAPAGATARSGRGRAR